jgi:hypothetical protein
MSVAILFKQIAITALLLQNVIMRIGSSGKKKIYNSYAVSDGKPGITCRAVLIHKWEIFLQGNWLVKLNSNRALLYFQ